MRYTQTRKEKKKNIKHYKSIKTAGTRKNLEAFYRFYSKKVTETRNKNNVKK